MYIESPTMPKRPRSNVQNNRLREVNPVVGKKSRSVEQIPTPTKPKTQTKTWKIILSIIAFGALGAMYLGHVFETQAILKEVTVLQREFDKVKRLRSDRRLMYQKMTGPAEVYAKAKELGLVNGGANDPVLEIEK